MKNLTDIIYQYKNEKFMWGEVDCCIFTASIVEEYTGRTLPHWRNVLQYQSAKGATKALKKLGCKTVLDLPSLILNTPQKDISEVKVGEPVYYIRKKDGRGLLGICNGVRAYFITKEGLTARNIDDCEYCWSIADG